MNMKTIRKSITFDKELVDKVSLVLQEKNLNLTECLSYYLQAVVKNPILIDIIEHKAKRRTGSFIGILDGKLVDMDYKEMKKLQQLGKFQNIEIATP